MEATEIRCSEGVFKSIDEFAEYLGVSDRAVHNRLEDGIKNGLSESDVIEKVILCSKLKKEFNLRNLPQYSDIVVFHGKYYPGVSSIINLMGWNKTSVQRLMLTGMGIEEIDQYYKTKKTFIDLLKSKVDENSKVLEEDGRLVIEVYGKKYESVIDLVDDYGMAYSTFRNRIKLPDVSICEALNNTRCRRHRDFSFSFLGNKFNSLAEFCNFYNLTRGISEGLLKDINKSENLFKWLYSIVEESEVSFDGNLEYLIRISRGLGYNKEDIRYQVQNYNNLKEGYTYYFDGKSYLTLEELHKNIPMLRSKRTRKLLNEEKKRIALFKVVCILNGNFEEITFKSPKLYVYCYFYDLLEGSMASFDDCLNEIYDMLREGLSASEIKKLLNGYRLLLEAVFKNDSIKINAFTTRYLSGSITRRSLLNYFNMESQKKVTGLRKFLQFSDLKVIRVSYRYNSLQYYLCVKGNSLCYLSGNDLLEIAVESIKLREGIIT